MPLMYYHVMHKDGEWYLYFGNSLQPVLVHPDRRKVLDTARRLARQTGMKIVIHKPSGQDGADEPNPEPD